MHEQAAGDGCVEEYRTGNEALEGDATEEVDELGDAAGTKGVKGVKVEPVE
jgi:hypothetical protein